MSGLGSVVLWLSRLGAKYNLCGEFLFWGGGGWKVLFNLILKGEQKKPNKVFENNSAKFYSIFKNSDIFWKARRLGCWKMSKITELEQKRDVMQNFWRDMICHFEWTRHLIGPRYWGQVMGQVSGAPIGCRYRGLLSGVSIGGRNQGQPIRGLVHSKRQIRNFAWYPSLTKICSKQNKVCFSKIC